MVHQVLVRAVVLESSPLLSTPPFVWIVFQVCILELQIHRFVRIVQLGGSPVFLEPPFVHDALLDSIRPQSDLQVVFCAILETTLRLLLGVNAHNVCLASFLHLLGLLFVKIVQLAVLVQILVLLLVFCVTQVLSRTPPDLSVVTMDVILGSLVGKVFHFVKTVQVENFQTISILRIVWIVLPENTPKQMVHLSVHPA
jgi:hypothetical protein